MVETVLICTFYSFTPLVAAATQYSPSKMLLLISKETKEQEELQGGLKQAKEVYKDILNLQIIEVKGSDVLATAKKVIELLEDEKGKKIIVNISGGKKLMSQGVLYGCYARPDMVDKIVCNDLVPGDKLVELPKLNFGVTSAKKELLQEIAAKKGRTIFEISKKMGKSRGMLYQHLKELKDAGFVDDKFEITLAGRLALL